MRRDYHARAALKHGAVNGWPLFWLLSMPMSAVMVVEMLGADLATAEGVSHMISYSVRWAVPLIYLVAATSALQTLFPGPVPAWLLRNRKFVGLTFAVAMAWQGLFIFIVSTQHRPYYFDEIYYLRDELEGSTGYLFLAAMVLTSFHAARKRLSAQQWRLLHTSGVYFLWAYPFSVYWWNLYYYENPEAIDYVFYWTGFAAFALRIAAWGSKRLKSARNIDPDSSVSTGAKAFGAVLILLGLAAAASGLQWQDTVTRFLTTPAWSANFELWVPFWPFEPFLPLAIIGLGAAFSSTPRTGRPSQEAVREPAG